MEMTPTRLCLIRHGETAWNADRRLQGHLDVPLNETGHVQAGAAAAGLDGQRFAALYCSDLERARQTAAAAARALGLAPFPDPALRERHYGGFQGLTYEQARERFPREYERFLAREPDFAFPGSGERLSEFAARVRSVLQRIVTRHPGSQVLVVTHGGVLDIAYRLATGKDLEAHRDFPIPNAALNWIEFDGVGWRLIAWADQRHLESSRDELPNA
jgi:probable phosphoglycerate mutase